MHKKVVLAQTVGYPAKTDRATRMALRIRPRRLPFPSTACAMNGLAVFAALALHALAPAARDLQSGTELSELFTQQVDRRLEVPEQEQHEYGERLSSALAEAGLAQLPPQYFVLNVFIDRYGVLDADYERAAADGKHFWVLRADREVTPWSGRYLVIVRLAEDAASGVVFLTRRVGWL